MKIILQDGTVINAETFGTAFGSIKGKAPDGNYGQMLLGFSVTKVPDVNGYPESYRTPQMYSRELPADLSKLRGYYAQFVDGRGQMYGWGVPIEKVEA